jgi:thymidine phosphorylase
MKSAEHPQRKSHGEYIRRKRDVGELSAAEIAHLVEAVTSGALSDAQLGALLMAMFVHGLSAAECEALTSAMADSGTRIRWDLDRPIVDKHSTGGVGDKVSLILAPLAAACGAAVPMISGRGLGHTGGTLDKLGAIPGYDATPGLERFKGVVRAVGCAIIGQTEELAPADRRLYAIRDVTATVESIPLITASILSKKLAAGIPSLVMDVKVGNGAFMDDRDDAHALAASLTAVGALSGMRIAALLTDMNEVLGHSAGNAVEMAEAVAFLKGEAADERLAEVTLELAAEMLALGGIVRDIAEGRERARAALASGAAAERFARMVGELGGPHDFLERTRSHLAAAPLTLAILPESSGFVSEVNTRAIGLAVVELGGGRHVETAQIDTAVGLTAIAGLGEWVERDRPLALCHARSEDAAQAAAALVRAAYTVSHEPPARGPLVRRLGT